MLKIIQLEPPNTDAHDYIIVTSQNAANTLKDGNQKVCVAGDKSRRILESKGYRIMLAAPDAESLYLAIITNITPSCKMLYLSGNHVAYPMDTHLAEYGYHTDIVEVYKSIAVTSLPENMLNDVDKILFYSPRTAGIFTKLCKDSVKGIEAICISTNTAARLKADFKKIKIADQPDENSMFELL